MRYVYLVKVGSLNTRKNEFQFYDYETFTSFKGALENIDNRIKVNKGFNIENNDTEGIFDKQIKEITYECLSVDKMPMKIRYVVYKLELKQF